LSNHFVEVEYIEPILPQVITIKNPERDPMSEKGIILDAKKGEALAIFGEDKQRMVLMASEAFVKMIETLNAFGTASFTILYMMGQEKGRYDVLTEMETARRHGLALSKYRLLENVVHQVRVTGWGAPRIHKFDNEHGSLTILVENNPLVVAVGKNGKVDRPLCHFFRGYWVGVVSEIFERKVSCFEIKCMGLGDVHCEFRITVDQ